MQDDEFWKEQSRMISSADNKVTFKDVAGFRKKKKNLRR